MSHDERHGGFFSRWSQRKAQAQRGEAPPAEPPAPVAPPPAAAEAPPAAAAQAEAPPPPTMDDVAQLHRGSDYSRFVAPDVDTGVKNAALKKLFADPHFNVMDGLDTYIDDYGKPDPLPAGMLRQMVQSRMLGLFKDDEDDKPEDAQDTIPTVLPHEDTDLRLQPDDAAGRPGTEPGPGGEPDRQR